MKVDRQFMHSAMLNDKQGQKTTSRHMQWSTWSLQRQLMTVVTAIGLAVVIGISLVFILRQNQTLKSQLEERAITTLISIDVATIDEIYFTNVDQIETIVTNFTEMSGIRAIRIYDADGRLLVATDDTTLGASLTNDPYAVTLLQIDSPQLEWRSDRLVAGQRVTVGNQVLGVIYVELSTSHLNNQLQISLLQSFVSAILVGIFGVVAVLFVSRSLTNPIATLVSQTRFIAHGDLTKPIYVQGGSSEITDLGATIEEMRHNLQKIYTELEQRVAERTVELKLARDEAIAAQRVADENSRLKSEFLSTMSHELRTPLNAIEGFTSIMLGGMGIELSSRAEDMVKRVSSNSKRLLHLINDFLDLSRIESGRLELIKEPISPQRLARKWEAQVGVLAEEKGILFTVDVNPDLPPLILSDEDALSKIAINLLSNAFKFTHKGQVSLNLQRVSNEWIIAVSDTGIGIPLHAREYIFDEFRQVDGSSKRLYGGTGLGLALVQKLARVMGGNVSLQSEIGEGSTFTVTLPLEIAEENEQGAVL